MSTKQEIIKQAYGERWEFVKDYVDENGWFPDSILGDAIWVLSECEREFINNELHWRITSLKGIEDNNGWIKIESYQDLPKETGHYWVKRGREIGVNYIIVPESFHSCFLANLTHYKPIEKPKPPIY